MQGKRRYAAVTALAVILAAVMLGGCSPMAAVYDNDKKIASDSNTYNLINYRGETTGQKYSAAIGKIEGMITVWTYTAEKEMQLELTYSIHVDSGKAKLVLIAPDGTLSTIAEADAGEALVDQQENSISIEVKPGKNRIKLVAGENTKMDFQLELPVGKYRE